ncbi:hypothetical protein BDF22DRAFT_733007 [Syncephalis plumigaleata]|nr:hypothetical protein BDF22DRAFT_733007 [Syncephalis plumigaleata]
MHILKQIYLSFAAYTLLAVGSYVANAKLTILKDDGTTATYPTSDYFLYNQPYYHVYGLGLHWAWLEDEGDCSLMTSDLFKYIDDNIVEELRMIGNTTITMTLDDAYNAGCTTIAEIGMAVDKLAEEFVKTNKPPITQIILLAPSGVPIDYEMWGPDELCYWSTGPSGISEGPPSINIALLSPSATEAYNIDTSNPFAYYELEQEPGVWNELYLSAGYIAYKWTLCALIICALLYTFARLFRLIQLKVKLHRLRLAAFAMASIAAILFLLQMFFPENTYKGVMVRMNLVISGILALDMILLYWSSYGETLFSKISLIGFRIAIAINALIGIIIYVAGNLAVNNVFEFHDRFAYAVDIMKLVASIVNFVIFGGFVIWFSYSMYKVRRHPKALARFTQLILFSTTALLMYMSILILTIIATYYIYNTGILPRQLIFATSIINELVLSVHSLVCLAILGVYWPRLDESTLHTVTASRTPLDGLTTIGGDTTMQDSSEESKSNDNYLGVPRPLRKRPSSIIECETITVEVVAEPSKKGSVSSIISSYNNDL